MIWTEPAKTDLRQIHEFIAHDSNYYAKHVTLDIVAKTEVLNELPLIGRVLPELNNEQIRELPMHSYRIIYEINVSDIFILAIVHKRRDLQVDSIKKRT